MSTPKLAIIIVTWNVRDLVLGCLGSVYEDLAHSDVSGDVWVVDNASKDDTVESVRQAFPQVQIIALEKNIGFGPANNRGLAAVGFPDGLDLPDYVLLLNPDTELQPGALKELLAGMESTGAGLGGSSLVYGDGSFQHSAFQFPGIMQLGIDLFPVPGRLYESGLNGRYARRLYEAGQPFEVDHPLGATFMVRRDVIIQTDGFDEAFFLYCEEVDWAMRIRDSGWQAVCIPGAVVTHYEGQSTRQVQVRSVVRLWTARLGLYRKHYGPLKNMLMRIILRAGMNRKIQQVARDSSRSEAEQAALIKAYRHVIDLTRVRDPLRI